MLKERHFTVDPRDEIIRQQGEKIQQLEEELAKLRALLKGKADAKAAEKPTFTENYSFDRNKRRAKSAKKKSTGRKPKKIKRQQATEQVDLYPDGIDRQACIRQRSQYAWRIIDGKATYVCYHINDLPGSRELSLTDGLRRSRSEFGIEIILILAFLH
jgi:hypothetical protein